MQPIGQIPNFLEVFDRFIDGENEQSGNGFILDRILPICSEPIELLRAKLGDPKLKRRMFEKILGLAIQAGDNDALQIAIDLVEDAACDLEVELDRPLAAASQLLRRNARSGWKIVWPAIEFNTHFAEGLFEELARESYAGNGLSIIQNLREDQLADAYIWIRKDGVTAHNTFGVGVITPAVALSWFAYAVMDNLSNRGTIEAFQQIRRVQEALPGEQLELVSKAAQDLIRRNTWVPLSPSELLALPGPRNPSATRNGAVVERQHRESTLAVADAGTGHGNAKRKTGRPPEVQTEEIHQAWIDLGRPEILA